MENTTNYNLQKYQSGDYFNPLTVGNPNLDVIDATMKSNSNRAIGRATELVSQGVHAITLLDVDCKTFKFIATGNYSAGETFTVNGIQVNAYTPSGSALVSNAFVTGSVVIASLNEDGNAITVYVSGTSTSDNSLRLGGELPAYYATQSDMTQAESDITNLQNQNGNTSIVGIGDGTTTGAISTLYNNLSDLQIKAQRGDFSMVTFDITKIVHTFTQSDTYTPSQDVFIYVAEIATNAVNSYASISVDGKVITAQTASGNGQTAEGATGLICKVSAGSTITTSANFGNSIAYALSV